MNAPPSDAMSQPPKRDFLTLRDFTREELEGLFERARTLKARGAVEKGGGEPDRTLEGRTLAMVFHKSSTRTRVSFEAGMFQLGGHALFLSSRDTQMGRGEDPRDTARVLSGYVDAVMVRTYDHGDVEALARHASVPVINGLTDSFHPCQVLADLFTATEEFGTELDGLPVAWIGDGNNMANSWVNAAGRFGLDLRLACPEGYDPDPEAVRLAREDGARVRLVRDPRGVVAGARVVSTDVWASMGQEGEEEGRREAFRDFRVDAEVMDEAARDAIFLHCLPAHRGEEVTAEVIDGPRSRVYPEAENRLHVQKALLLALLAPDGGEGTGGGAG